MKSSKPDFKTLEFIQNETRRDVYDLQTKGFRKFTYFRLSMPRSPRFRSQGAKYIIESWKDGAKTLFSGLIPFVDSYYYGDHKSATSGRKSFIIAKFEQSTIIIFYFNNYNLYPAKRLDFVRWFINNNARPPQPGISSKPSTEAERLTNIR